jgi:diguanylate cyclase (GGDEF)-like protein
MLAIVAVAFVSDILVLIVIGRWLTAEELGRLAVIHAFALALTIAPAVYFLVLRPLRREGERRVAAEQRARRADRLALTDPLTEVLNRRGIKAGLLEAMAQAERYGRPLSVAMLDLDGFKRVNDLHGHAVGDDVLRRAAHAVREQLRGPDRFGRFGGDEFLIALPETGITAARAMSERIAAALAATPFALPGGALALSASFGLVEFRHEESLQALLERVDADLYAAKAARAERRQSEPA